MTGLAGSTWLRAYRSAADWRVFSRWDDGLGSGVMGWGVREKGKFRRDGMDVEMGARARVGRA